LHFSITSKLALQVDRDISAGVATCYGLDGPGIKYLNCPERPPGATQASYTKDTGSVSELKQPGRGVDHPPPSSAEGLRRLFLGELVLYIEHKI
jgi:hypothetical protein